MQPAFIPSQFLTVLYNKVHISYYDSGDLKYITNATGSWVAETVDSIEAVGSYTSLAIDSQDKVHISYYDASNGDLKYITNATGAWVAETVDSAGRVGLYTSIAIDSQDKVHISYYDDSNEALKYITNATGSWVPVTVDNAGDVGRYTSIALDSQDKVHISYDYEYYDDYHNKCFDLKYITNATGSWVVETVDNAGDVGDYASLAIDPSDKVHISYYDASNEDLKYAKNCFDMDSDCDDALDYEDNCPNDYNPSQIDTYPPQGNNIGDACDCESDFNCDGNVDANDVTAFLGDFGRSTFFNPCTNADPCNGDVDCNVNVDADDVTMFLQDFGRSQFNNPCPPCEVGEWCIYP